MAKTSKRTTVKKKSFDAPAEPEWHRLISEAAYYRAQQRGFRPGEELEDWLRAEREVRERISPSP
jgi:hypothetical protein